jgi:hypothetical protein
MPTRVRRSTFVFLWLAAFAAQASAAAPGRGTPERLARAKLVRDVRAGKVPSRVGDAGEAGFLEMSHLVSPSRETVMDYARYHRVVFLADGLPQKWESLAEPIAHLFPQKLVVKGDFEIAGTQRFDNLVAMHIDNSQKLPLEAHSADLVVMRRGLCLCHGTAMCGGLKVKTPAMRRFFREVYRVLDRNNPDAVAYLHGAYGAPERIDVFQKAADELMADHPEMKVELVTRSGIFAAVRISHRVKN